MKRLLLCVLIFFAFVSPVFADSWGTVQGGANDGLNYYYLEWQTSSMSYSALTSSVSPYTVTYPWTGTTNYAKATSQIPIVGTIYRVEVPPTMSGVSSNPSNNFDMFLSGITPIPVNVAGSTIFSLPNLGGATTTPVYVLPSAATPWVTAPVTSTSYVWLDVYNTHSAASGDSVYVKRGGVSIYYLPPNDYGTLSGSDIKYHTWHWFTDYYGRYVVESAIPIIGNIIGFQQLLGDLTPKTALFSTYLRQLNMPTNWVSNTATWTAPTLNDKLFNAGAAQTITSGTGLTGTSFFILPGTSGSSMFVVPVFNAGKLTLQIAAADGGVSPQQKRGKSTVYWR